MFSPVIGDKFCITCVSDGAVYRPVNLSGTQVVFLKLFVPNLPFVVLQLEIVDL